MADQVAQDQTRGTQSIQDAIARLPQTGGLLRLGAFTYTIDEKLTIANIDYLEIRGTGRGTVLKAVAALNDHIIEIDWDTVTEVKIADLQIDGNGTNQTSGIGSSDGITYKSGTTGKTLRIENVYITNTKGSGIDYKGTGLYIRDLETNLTQEHGVVFRGGSSVLDADGLILHHSSNHGITLEGTASTEVTDIELHNVYAYENTKNGISGIKVARFNGSNFRGYSNTWSLFDIERLETFQIHNVVAWNNDLRGFVLEEYPGANWAPTKNGTVSGISGYDNGFGLVAIQEIQNVDFYGIEGYNCSRVQDNIGALVEVRYNPAYTYDATHRNLYVTLNGLKYEDTRAVSNSTYGVAMNGSNGSTAGGDYITVNGSRISGVTLDKIRFINDGTTSTNTIINDV